MLDAAGDLFIADIYNLRIRKVGTNGIITTVAGNGTYRPGYSGDGGAATNAELYDPYGLAMDTTGNLFIGDSGKPTHPQGGHKRDYHARWRAMVMVPEPAMEGLWRWRCGEQMPN